MKNSRPEVIDLYQLKIDVLDRGPSAALPSELSDFWLEQVALSLDQALENLGPESGRYLAAPLALVVHLLHAKSGSSALQVTHSRLYECLCNYRVELALEDVSRRTNVRSTSASVETIFTDRVVTSYEDPRDE